MTKFFFRGASPPPPPPQRHTNSNVTFGAQKEPVSSPDKCELQSDKEELMWTTDVIQAALSRRARIQVRDTDSHLRTNCVKSTRKNMSTAWHTENGFSGALIWRWLQHLVGHFGQQREFLCTLSNSCTWFTGTEKHRRIVTPQLERRNTLWQDVFQVWIQAIHGEVWPSSRSFAFILPGGYVWKVMNACTCIDCPRPPMMLIAPCFTISSDGKNTKLSEKTMAGLGVTWEIAGPFLYIMELQAL